MYRQGLEVCFPIDEGNPDAVTCLPIRTEAIPHFRICIDNLYDVHRLATQNAKSDAAFISI